MDRVSLEVEEFEFWYGPAPVVVIRVNGQDLRQLIRYESKNQMINAMIFEITGADH